LPGFFLLSGFSIEQSLSPHLYARGLTFLAFATSPQTACATLTHTACISLTDIRLADIV
jgi:hypothetical protein